MKLILDSLKYEVSIVSIPLDWRSKHLKSSGTSSERFWELNNNDNNDNSDYNDNSNNSNNNNNNNNNDNNNDCNNNCNNNDNNNNNNDNNNNFRLLTIKNHSITITKVTT